MRVFSLFVISSALLLIGGCAAVSITTRTLRFDSPEVSGENRFEFAVMAGETAKVYLGELNSDIFNPGNYFYTDQNKIRPTQDFNTRLGFGLMSCADLFTEFGVLWGGKLALVGCGAKPGDAGLRASVSLATGLMSSSQQTGSGNTSLSSKANGLVYDGALNIGYRFKPGLLVYTNFYASQYNVYAEFRQNDALVASKSTDGTLVGALPGIQLSSSNQKFAFFIEGGYSRILWRFIPEQRYSNAGAGIRIRW